MALGNSLNFIIRHLSKKSEVIGEQSILCLVMVFIQFFFFRFAGFDVIY